MGARTKLGRVALKLGREHAILRRRAASLERSPPWFARASMNLHGRASVARPRASERDGDAIGGGLATVRVSSEHRSPLVDAENANKAASPSRDPAGPDVVDAPPSEVRLTAPFNDADLRVFLSRPDTQARIREVVVGRIYGKAPASLVDDLVQNANVEALTSKSRPRSAGTARGWLGTVTARSVARYFRREAVHAKWLQREVEVDELPVEPEGSTGSFAPDWLLTKWLAPLVAEDPRDAETYELLLYKASTRQTLAQVAVDHGMTEGALKSRVHALKTKYAPRWRRRQRMFLLLFLFGAAVLAAVLWLLSRSHASPRGPLVPAESPALDGVLGGPLPVSRPPPNGGRETDGASGRTR